MNRRELYEFIARKRAEFGLTAADLPVEPLALAAQHGAALVVERVPFAARGIRGMHCKGPVSVIALNARHGPEERRFDLAHELIHYWCDEDDTILRVDRSLRPTESAYKEWRANEGAAELLVPREILVPLAAGQALDAHRGLSEALPRDAPWMTAAAALFGVTEPVIRYRLRSLHLEIDTAIRAFPS